MSSSRRTFLRGIERTELPELLAGSVFPDHPYALEYRRDRGALLLVLFRLRFFLLAITSQLALATLSSFRLRWMRRFGNARLEDVRNRFGERVARIVKACSDSLADTAKGERKAHWQERNKAYLAHLQTADEDILRTVAARSAHLPNDWDARIAAAIALGA